MLLPFFNPSFLSISQASLRFVLLRRFLFSTNNIATTVLEIQVKKLLTHSDKETEISVPIWEPWNS